MDSLLVDKSNISFQFKANIGQSVMSLINDENSYHKITGNIIIGNNCYPTTALVRAENILSGIKKVSRTVLDIKLQFEPSKVQIPCLSSYFNKTVLFKINNGVVYQSL